VKTAFLLSLAALAAGLVIVFTVHSLLGVALIVGGVGGVGWVGFTVGIERIAVFLSTGTWRR
jgi:hypothetical protein